MKSFPATVKIAGLIILTILLVQACDHRMIPAESGKPAEIVLEGAEVKEPEKFCEKVKGSVTKDATYAFVVISENPFQVCCEPANCKVQNLTVKIDNITKAPAAETSAGKSPLFGSHVTQRLSSLESKDLELVVGELKSEP